MQDCPEPILPLLPSKASATTATVLTLTLSRTMSFMSPVKPLLQVLPRISDVIVQDDIESTVTSGAPINSYTGAELESISESASCTEYYKAVCSMEVCRRQCQHRFTSLPTLGHCSWTARQRFSARLTFISEV